MVGLVVSLAHHDVQDALEVVHAASASNPQATIELLARLIPCELLSYSEWELDGPSVTRCVEQPGQRCRPQWPKRAANSARPTRSASSCGAPKRAP
jgi:hypothetical protein